MSDYSLDQKPYTYINEYNDTDDSNNEQKKSFPIIIIVAVGIILLIALIILLFGTNNTTPSQNNQDNNQNLSGNILWRGVFLDKKIINELIDEYKKTRPNVNIIYDNVWDNSKNQLDQIVEYQNNLNRIIGGNNILEMPDIFMIKNTWVGDYESRILPHPTKNRSSLEKEYYRFVVEDFAQNGAINGLPLWVDTFAIVYNEDLIIQGSGSSNIPNSLDAFLNFVQKFNKNTSLPFAMGTTRNVNFAFEFFQILLRTEGINFDVDNAGLTNNFDFTRFRNAFSFFKNFLNSWDINANNDSLAFLNGELAMVFVPSYRLREILRFNDLRNLNLNIKVAEVPFIEKKINVADYWGLVVSRNSLNPIVAWDFIDWLSENEQLEKLHILIENEVGYFGNLFPKENLNEKLKNNKLLSIYVNELKHIQTWYQIKGTEIQIEFEKILNKTTINSNELQSLNNEIRRLQQRKGIFSEITR